jgi:hypothetical protein
VRYATNGYCVKHSLLQTGAESTRGRAVPFARSGKEADRPSSNMPRYQPPQQDGSRRSRRNRAAHSLRSTAESDRNYFLTALIKAQQHLRRSPALPQDEENEDKLMLDNPQDVPH